MARKRIARAREGRAPSHSPVPRAAKRRPARLTRLVKRLTAKVIRRTSPRATSTPRPQAPASPPVSFGVAQDTVPSGSRGTVRRRSVVRKPARGPTVRAARPSPRAAKHPEASGREIRRPEAAPIPGSPPVPPATPAPWVLAPAEAAPAETPAQAALPSEGPEAIPTRYGDDRIVLMVKDPWWLYAYWEIQPATERAARSQLPPQEVAGLQTILRVSDVTGLPDSGQPAHRSFDIGLSGLATSWFIQVDAPDREFVVEIGLLTAGGRFLLLARSNRVRTPRFGPSDVLDERWLSTDDVFWKLFGAGIGTGSSLGGWAQVLTRQLSSGQWSSGSLAGWNRQSLVRGFWCRVSTDLIIHGATEPRAKVTVQGQPVPVRRDGTFSLRVALPEGTQHVTVDVTSPDGRHTKTVTPLVSLVWSGPLASSGPPPAPAARQARASRSSRPAPPVEPQPDQPSGGA